MKSKKTFNVHFRRKRQGRTYYKKRIKLLLSNACRFVVRKSLKNTQASIVQYNTRGDKVIFTINSKMLEKYGWKGDNGNLPSAYLTGFLVGKKAVEKGIKSAILDLGFNKSTKGSKLYAAVLGALDSGLKIPVDQSILPQKNRVAGEHIANYSQLLKTNEARYKKQFCSYLERGMNPEDITKHFNEIKDRING